jgi:hypothetical protein
MERLPEALNQIKIIQIMKPICQVKTTLTCLCFAAAMASACAQSLKYSSTVPTIGPSDVSNLNAGGDDHGNVNAGDDAATYLAMDRGAIGQTFTTGDNAGGYTLNGVWLKQVAYADTWWDVTHPEVQLTYRLVNPGAKKSSQFVLHTATCKVTGTEPNNFGSCEGAVGTGTGSWVFFSFGKPIHLAPNKAYGFDVATAATEPGFYFETAGNDADVYAGGAAYTTVRGGNTMMTYTGDRVFVVNLTAVVVTDP